MEEEEGGGGGGSLLVQWLSGIPLGGRGVFLDPLLPPPPPFTSSPLIQPSEGPICPQAFRWFDCDMHYLDPELGVLIKALQSSTRHARRTYYRQILASRRRIQKNWDDTPVTKVFRLGNEFHLLHSKVQCLKIREALVCLTEAYHRRGPGCPRAKDVWGIADSGGDQTIVGGLVLIDAAPPRVGPMPPPPPPPSLSLQTALFDPSSFWRLRRWLHQTNAILRRLQSQP